LITQISWGTNFGDSQKKYLNSGYSMRGSIGYYFNHTGVVLKYQQESNSIDRSKIGVPYEISSSVNLSQTFDSQSFLIGPSTYFNLRKAGKKPIYFGYSLAAGITDANPAFDIEGLKVIAPERKAQFSMDWEAFFAFSPWKTAKIPKNMWQRAWRMYDFGLAINRFKVPADGRFSNYGIRGGLFLHYGN
jgi:hypothetical protein